jgi:tRNA-modifying protein YgfZ
LLLERGDRFVTTFASLLSDRGVVRVTGLDAGPFLHGLLTNDIEHLPEGGLRYAGLLSPQGKILFDMFVHAAGEDGYVIDVARALAPDLVKRFGLYKLRRKVTIEDASATLAVAALWGGDAAPADALVADDPRLPGLGRRAVLPAEGAAEALTAAGATLVPPADYHAHRISLLVPESGRDFAIGDTYPHEADMDLLAGVDFKKGCYVGQEVVSRMHHKTTVRKRVVAVRVPGVRPVEGVDVVAGEVAVGYMGSSNRDFGLAMLRLDRVKAADGGLVAGGLAVEAVIPPWMPEKVLPV